MNAERGVSGVQVERGDKETGGNGSQEDIG